jgi:pimeloyl-ACP methyl ester carboxylesterase
MDTDTIVSELTIRPASEAGRLLGDPVFWGFGVPRGDGHSVLVLPGLFAGDTYLRPLRGWLMRVGYKPVRSGLRLNPGWSEDLVYRLGELTEQAFNRTQHRITIIGHSMGGVISRSIAVRRPYAVRRVIAIGSPVGLSPELLPDSVGVASIFSRDDAIVHHSRALARDTHAQNLAVSGSHIGLVANAEVYRHLARLLRSP